MDIKVTHVHAQSHSARKLLVLDCCHAGAVRGAAAPVRLNPCFANARGKGPPLSAQFVCSFQAEYLRREHRIRAGTVKATARRVRRGDEEFDLEVTYTFTNSEE